MDLFQATLLWLAGTVLLALTVQQLRRANPNEKLPQWFGHPRNHPGEVYVYRAIALVLLLVSAQAWTEGLHGWATMLILFATVPALIVNAQH
ncbi:MAG: hypothetical protein L0L05_09045, partial [Yaniella sp.]|nr:hypothetical protein [Yaniella sp.]